MPMLCTDNFMTGFLYHNFQFFNDIIKGQVDSPEMPKITEMTENFTKVAKYLTKLKHTLIKYVYEKSHIIKQ